MFKCVGAPWHRFSLRNETCFSSKIASKRVGRDGNLSIRRKFSYEEDPYRVLGVSRNSTKEEVRKAYREMAKKTHPDHNKGSSTKDFLRVKKAFEAISTGNVGGGQQQQQPPKYSNPSYGNSGTTRNTSYTYTSTGYRTSEQDNFNKHWNQWGEDIDKQHRKGNYKFTHEEEKRKDKFNKNSNQHPNENWEEWLKHVDDINKNNEKNRPRPNEQWKAQVNRDSFFYGSTGFKGNTKTSTQNSNYSNREPINLNELFQKYAQQFNVNVKKGSVFDVIRGFFEVAKQAENVVRNASNLLPRELRMIQTGKTVMLQGNGNQGGSITLPPFSSPSAASVLFWTNNIMAQSRLISLQGSSLKMKVTDNANNLLGHFTMTRTATIPLIGIELGFKYVFHNAEGTIISNGRSYHFLNMFNYFKFERRGDTLAKMIQFPFGESWNITFHPSVAKEATLYTFAMAYQMLGGITQRK